MGVLTQEHRFGVLRLSLAPAQVAATTSAEQTFTVPGLLPTDVVFVNKPSLTANIGVGNCRVSAANTLAITFVNANAAATTPATETYTIFVLRPDGVSTGGFNP